MIAKSGAKSLIFALVVALTGAPASADTTAGKPSAASEARARYERGIHLFEDGAYDAALTELSRAYELAPSYKILYNIAKVNLQINDHAAALRAYERYLSSGGKEISKSRKSEVEAELTRLHSLVATLRITASAADADITVDDVSVGKSPLSLMVNAGRRKITASVAGRPPVTKVVTVAGADSSDVVLDLPELAPIPPPVLSATAAPPPVASEVAPVVSASASTAPPPPPADSAPESSSIAPIVAWSFTGAFATGAIVTGALALSASSSLKSDRQSPDATRSSLDDAHSKQRTLAIVSDTLSAATILGAGVALYLTFRQHTADETIGRSGVELGVVPGGVRLRGSFLARGVCGTRNSSASLASRSAL